MIPLVIITSVYRSYRPHPIRRSISVPATTIAVASVVVVNATASVHIAHIEVRIARVSVHTTRCEPVQLCPNVFIL